MPGSARSCVSFSRETASPAVATVSAADRYARILKAFSPLISSRSTISPRTCAIEALSTGQPVPLEREVDHAGAATGERLPDRGSGFRRTETEQAAAAT